MSLDIDIQLREFCDFMDETQGPLTVDDILERTGDVPVIPGRGKAIRGRPVSRRLITAAAAVIAVVLVGLALRFLPVLQRDVPPATDDIPTTTNSTAPPPQGAEAAQGTLDTPMGTFSWWHLTGVDAELPDPGWPVKSESGYSLIVGPWGGGLEYWRSPDGKAWLQAPLPGFAGASAFRVVLVGDYWLITEEPTSLWRSEDGETWVEVPLPLGYNGTPYGSLQEVNGAVWLTNDDPGVWRLDGTSWTSLNPGSIGPGDIRSLNTRTGVERGPVANDDITVVVWDFDSLSVIDSGDQGIVVKPPWATPLDEAQEGVGIGPSLTVLASRGQFLAFVTKDIPGTTCPSTRPGCDPEPQPMIEMWTSPDGLTWTGPTRPGFLPDEGGAYGMFRTEGDLVIGEVFGPFGPGQVWISEDGTSWSDARIPGQNSFSFVRLDSGAIYFGDYPHLEMFFSADLRNWERVDVSAMSAFGGSGNGRSMFFSAGDTAFAMVVDDGTGRHAMWILELQE